MFSRLRAPSLLYSFYPSLVWENKTKEKKVWLTFDDGPTQEVTEFVLETLLEYNVKATFFCLGTQLSKYPEILNRIIASGHAIGNHSYSHLSGFFTSSNKYYKDIEKCYELIPQTKLFRPPFGHIYPWQIKKLKGKYKIIMWDVMAGDFKKSISKKQCYKNVMNYVRNGSIIVLHDNKKSYENLKYLLPRILTQLKADGYSFSTTW